MATGGEHNLPDQMETAEFKTSGRMVESALGFHYGWGTTVGNRVEGWAPNAQFVHSDGGAAARTYTNVGTKTSSDWSEVSTVVAGEAIALNAASYLWAIDNAYVALGTGSDVKLMWNGTYLEGGPATGMWATAPSPADPQYFARAYDFFDDFLDLPVGDGTSRWNLDQTGGTAVLGAGETVGLGGVLVLGVPGSSAEDFAFIKATSNDTGCAFKITKDSGKKLWYQTRLRTATALDDHSVYFGLFGEAEVEPFTDDTGAEDVQDGVYFRSLNNAPTECDTCVNKNTTESEVKADACEILNTAYHTYGIYFDGVNTITFYYDGTALADTVAADATNFPHDEALCVGMGLKAGDTNAEYLWIDYVKCMQLR